MLDTLIPYIFSTSYYQFSRSLNLILQHAVVLFLTSVLGFYCQNATCRIYLCLYLKLNLFSFNVHLYMLQSRLYGYQLKWGSEGGKELKLVTDVRTETNFSWNIPLCRMKQIWQMAINLNIF